VPDVVIVLGEELGRFRDASKTLYKFLESFTWSERVERLGFDEVFMDVTDLVEYNQALLNPNDLAHAFFQLKRNDPTSGFNFDATTIAGHTFPQTPVMTASPQAKPWVPPSDDAPDLLTRLILGSHLAQHLRWSLEKEKGYTSTVGISTNKLLSKLVGNLNKPKGQTTLLPPYTIPDDDGHESSITSFIDGHDIGKIPGIGFKMSHRIRNHCLSRTAEYDTGLIYGETKESVRVRDVRLFSGMGPELLEKIIGGPGTERGIGGKAWALINGIDDTEVQQAKKVPSQISIEDSYIRLDTMNQVLQELRILATSLIKRMHTDLLEDDKDGDAGNAQHWIAHPKTVRLSTRPRPPLNADGTRARSFNRISRSSPLPNFVFNLKEGIDYIVEKLVQESLIPMFRKLHAQQGGWNLSLINICVTNMVVTASEDGSGGGRDIGRMFKRQEEVLKEWKVEDRDIPPDPITEENTISHPHDVSPAESSAGVDASDIIIAGSEDVIHFTQNSVEEVEHWDDEDNENQETCDQCGALMPAFALAAHERFHTLGEY
jgi:DNA polymerase iota